MASLTKEQRDALSDEDFAAPAQRKLPIRGTPDDTRHTLMAWSQLAGTRGLTDDERKAAKARILMRARELGLDTADWGLHAVTFRMEAMSLAMPSDAHPNRMPFTGVLTRVNEPSDEPPGGAAGKRVFIPAAVAEAALSTLLGMGVDYTRDFSAHDPKRKMGVMTEATIKGNALHIAGFFYAHDFPEECARIKAEQSKLGFSYECQVAISDQDADPWMVDRIIFTGAAVLYKADAAYHSTSLAASHKDDAMTPEELKKLNDSIAALAASVSTVSESQKAINEKLKTLEAGKGASLAGPIIDQAMPHVGACNACADAMEAAGIGTHPVHGHAAHIRRIGASILHAATMGKLPHIYRDHSYFGGDGMEASADKALKEAQDAKAKADVDLKAALDGIAGLKTEIADLKAAQTKITEPPVRKTSPTGAALLSKYGIKASDEVTPIETVDAALSAAKVTGREAIAAKLRMRAAGAI